MNSKQIKSLMDFTINPAYLTDVTIHEEWNTYTNNGRVPTAEELLLILQGKGNCSSTSSADHPEFTKLREQLGADGYISIQRGQWNGDSVLKPFTLNGRKFKVGAQFSCGSAMGTHLIVRAKHPEMYKDEYDDETVD
jgi:hypothetical protein